MSNLSQYANLGAVAIIFIFFLREFFAYLKVKKNGNGNYKAELASINLKLANHLTTVNGKIDDVQREMTEIKMDIKNIQQDINRILITLKK